MLDLKPEDVRTHLKTLYAGLLFQQQQIQALHRCLTEVQSFVKDSDSHFEICDLLLSDGPGFPSEAASLELIEMNIRLLEGKEAL